MSSWQMAQVSSQGPSTFSTSLMISSTASESLKSSRSHKPSELEIPLLDASPTGSMYGIFTYIWLIFMVNVGKYTIHGSYGSWNHQKIHVPNLELLYQLYLIRIYKAVQGVDSLFIGLTHVAYRGEYFHFRYLNMLVMVVIVSWS